MVKKINLNKLVEEVRVIITLNTEASTDALGFPVVKGADKAARKVVDYILNNKYTTSDIE